MLFDAELFFLLEIFLGILQPIFQAIRDILENDSSVADKQILLVSVDFDFVTVESEVILDGNER